MPPTRKRKTTRKQKTESELVILLVVLAIAALSIAGIWYIVPVLGLGALLLGAGMLMNNRAQRSAAMYTTSIEDVDAMTGIQFEKFLAMLFMAQGYSVTPTATSGDFGADLIIQKDGKRTVVQAKCYSKNVGVSAVQETVGAMAKYHCSGSMVVTNAYFTNAAVELARVNQVELRDRDILIRMMHKVTQQKNR
jgi:restriction system protein